MKRIKPEQKILAKQPAYRAIAAGLKDQILNGELPSGALMPSTRTIAATSKASYFTAHTAVMALVKEGWAERIPGSGTYVADAGTRFLCAGIYHGLDFTSELQTSFGRRLHNLVIKRLNDAKKRISIFVDPRPGSAREKLLPSLAEAIRMRSIQSLIVLSADSNNLPALSLLKIPTAFLCNGLNVPQAGFDEHDFARGGIQRLVAQGCRRIGFISPLTPRNFEEEYDMRRFFRLSLKEAGLPFVEEWSRQPKEFLPAADSYGAREMHRLWNMPRRPDGIIVYPDSTAQGVIVSALALGTAVPSELKFVLHRNAGSNLLCPFPVTWAISDEEQLAKALVELIFNQFRGKTSPIKIIPYRFEEDSAKNWRNE